MSNLEDKIDNSIEKEVEIDDSPTLEEQKKIESIQYETFSPKKEEEAKPLNFWSFFNFNLADLATAAGAPQTQVSRPFNIQNILHLDNTVIINNISGKNAYLVLTPAPIRTLNSFGLGIGLGGVDASIEASLDTQGKYKIQKMSIANNTSSKYELDNIKFYCTLFIDIDGEWKKSWENRKFNGRKFNINILEKHVSGALNKENIPSF